MQMVVIVGAAAALLGGGAGWYAGNGLAAGKCAARELAVAQAYASAQNAAVAAANAATAAERKRADAAQAARSRTATAAAVIRHEIAADTDRGCEWRDPHRLRVEQLYRAHGYNPDGTAD